MSEKIIFVSSFENIHIITCIHVYIFDLIQECVLHCKYFFPCVKSNNGPISVVTLILEERTKIGTAWCPFLLCIYFHNEIFVKLKKKIFQINLEWKMGCILENKNLSVNYNKMLTYCIGVSCVVILTSNSY